MFHDLPPIVSPQVAATEAVTPSPEPPPANVPAFPPPSVEQAQTADHCFTEQPQRDAAATAFGVWMSAILLRDLAVDALQKPAEEELSKQDDDDEESSDSEQ